MHARGWGPLPIEHIRRPKVYISFLYYYPSLFPEGGGVEDKVPH